VDSVSVTVITNDMQVQHKTAARALHHAAIVVADLPKKDY
jgi:hypothetical protein